MLSSIVLFGLVFGPLILAVPFVLIDLLQKRIAYNPQARTAARLRQIKRSWLQPKKLKVKPLEFARPSPDMNLSHFGYYPIGQDPRPSPIGFDPRPRPADIERPKAEIEYYPARILAKPKHARPRSKAESVRRIFQRYNPDVDPAIIDFSGLVDDTLSVKANIMQFSRDPQLSSFEWPKY